MIFEKVAQKALTKAKNTGLVQWFTYNGIEFRVDPSSRVTVDDLSTLFEIMMKKQMKK